MTNVDYSRMKVLVIDDQQFIRRIIRTLLLQLGFNEIEEAEDGASGIEAHNKFQPDLVICDINMEPVDGLVFLQTLREADDAKKSDTTVIFLTQHTEADIVKKARSLNVNAFVLKPPSYEKLRNRIEFALNQNS